MCVLFSDISAPELKCLSVCNASTGSPGKCSMPATNHGSISSHIPSCLLMGIKLVDHVTHSCLEIGRVGFLNLKVYKSALSQQIHFFYIVVRSTFTVGVMHLI